MTFKKLIRIFLIIISVLLIEKPIVFSQATIPVESNIPENKPLTFFVGLSYTNSIPLHDYFEKSGFNPQGFSVSAGIKNSNFPISIGLSVDFLMFNNKIIQTNNQHIVSGTYADGWTSGIIFPLGGYVGYGFNDYPKDYYRRINAIIPVSVFARIEPIKKKYFQPFLEFSVGVNSQCVLGLPNIQSKYNFLLESWEFEYYYLTYFYGLALGTTVNINDIIDAPPIFSNINLDFKMRYIKGVRTASLNRYLNSHITEENLIYKQEDICQTDFIFYSLGLIYLF